MSDKYDKLVYEIPKEINAISTKEGDMGYIFSPQAYFRGASQIPGSDFNIGFQIVVKPFFLDRVPHRHKVDEYLFFLGGMMPNVFEFDADIEFSLGTPGEDAKTYHITKPTVIRIPAGVTHCPLNFKRIDKPVMFMAALMQDMFSATYDFEDGKKELWYNGPHACKFDPTKKCNSCRKCITDDWQE